MRAPEQLNISEENHETRLIGQALIYYHKFHKYIQCCQKILASLPHPTISYVFLFSLSKSLSLSLNSQNRSTQMRNSASCHQIVQQPTSICALMLCFHTHCTGRCILLLSKADSSICTLDPIYPSILKNFILQFTPQSIFYIIISFLSS